MAVTLSILLALQAGPLAAVAQAYPLDTDMSSSDPEDMLADVNYDLTSAVPLLADAAATQPAEEPLLAAADASVEELVAAMSLDEKISQLIVPSIRTWYGSDVTELPEDLGLVLQRHQFGGVILYGTNMTDAAQTASLTAALQSNNAQGSFSARIPYLVCTDAEGGSVVRLETGTRMTGNMAIGATGANAATNAQLTGRVLGEELAAVGVNVNLAPDTDVMTNPDNTAIGTRSFSNDPATVAELGTAFAQGLGEAGVVATYKHFPGQGAATDDTHEGLAVVDKSHDELMQSDLVPFKKAIDAGADLIMAGHVTLPQIDDAQILADGSMAFYPATLSHKVLTELLRDELGYQGVVMSDALEMDAIVKGNLVPDTDPLTGAEGSFGYMVNVSTQAINAGCDLLLVPADLDGQDMAVFYDAYVAALARHAELDPTLAARIDESVTRVLTLKRDHGILALDATAEPDLALAAQTVGSEEHLALEAQVATDAVTLLKNDGETLPIIAKGSKIVIVGRDQDDAPTISHAIEELQGLGLIPSDAHVTDLAGGSTSGSTGSSTSVTIGYYYNDLTGTLHYTDALKTSIGEADFVIVCTENDGLDALAADSALHQGVSQILTDAHAAGAKCVLLSENLPYDAARYQDADAIMCAYQAATTGETDPETGDPATYNANVMAALESLFDNMPPTGSLPVNVPALVENEDGSVSYGTDVVYPSGTGLSYNYRFTSGTGGRHYLSTSSVLRFTNNARYDLLQSVKVDGTVIDPSNYTASAGTATNLTLKAAYLNQLSAGRHTLTTTHAYDPSAVDVETYFTIIAASNPDPEKPEPEEEKFTKGMNGKRIANSTKSLPFESTVSKDQMVAIKVDGKTLDSRNYTYQDNKLVLTANYLNTLGIGKHAVAIVYEDALGEGEISTNFTIEAEADASPTKATKPALNTTTTAATGSSTTTTLASTGDIVTGAPFLAGMASSFIGTGALRRRKNRRRRR